MRTILSTSILILVVLAPLQSTAQDVTQRGRLPRLKMPGESFQGELPELTLHESKIADLLGHDVKKLARVIGERNVHNYRKLVEAEAYLADEEKHDGQARRPNRAMYGG